MTRLKLNCSMSFSHLFIRKSGLSLPLPQMMKIAIFIVTNFCLALIIFKNYYQRYLKVVVLLLTTFLLLFQKHESIIAPFAFSLFTQIVISLTRPVSWKRAHITPLLKSASEADIKKYSGISILSRVLLVMEKMLYNFFKKKFAINSLTVSMAFDLEKVRSRYCLIMLISSIFFKDKKEEFRCV